VIRPAASATLALALAACTGASTPDHAGDVILITVDALRADHITPELTPTISRLSAEALAFTNARANSSHPLQSAATLLTGLLPTRGGSIGLLEAQPSSEAQTLAESLRSTGYTTGLVSSQPLLGAAGFRRGYSDLQVARTGETWSAHEVAQRAAEVLEDTGANPCFLHVHFADPHEPHTSSEPDAHPSLSFAELRQRIASGATGPELCTESELESLRSAYRAEIASVDAAIAELLQAIAARAHPAGTLILFTSTCGEEFLEHGYVGHAWTLHEEVLRVPLLLHAPGTIPPAIDTQPVSLVDIAPTLADLLALPERSIGFDGDALLVNGRPKALGERELLAELIIRERTIQRAVITQDAKHISASLYHAPAERPAISSSYIESLRAAASGELELPATFGEPMQEFPYDLRNDPHERTPLGAMSRVSTSKLRAVLEDYRAYCAAHGLAPTDARLVPSFQDSSGADALEALGYL